jgi:hypothetical protein
MTKELSISEFFIEVAKLHGIMDYDLPMVK